MSLAVGHLTPVPTPSLVESRKGAVAGAVAASLRFLSPLVKPDLRICQVDQPLLAFTPTDPGVRSYRTRLFWKVTCGVAATLCQD